MSAIDDSFLETGSKWSNTEIQQLEFSFPTSDPAYYFGAAALFLDPFFVPFTDTQITSDANPSNFDQQDVVRFLLSNPNALAGYSGSDTINTVLVDTANTPLVGGGTENYRVSYPDIINAFFSESSTLGQIIVMDQNAYSSTELSKGFIPTLTNQSLQTAGDVFINSLDTAALTQLAPGQYGFWLLTHELGHAIGGFDDVVNTAEVNTSLDSQRYTIMSYNPLAGVYADGLQLLDIEALQDTYGQRNYTTRADNTEYALGQGLGFAGSTEATPFLYTIWDGSGTDIINASGFSSHVTIDLRQGDFSSIGVNGLGGRR